jgi:HAUS augmin-like complex subunit 3
MRRHTQDTAAKWHGCRTRPLHALFVVLESIFYSFLTLLIFHRYSVSEKEKLEAEIDLARARAAFETTKMQMMREQYYQSMDDASAKSKVMEYKSQIVKDRQLLKRQLDQHIPELILQVAQLQTAPILWGDYNLKIARQRYKQHKIQKAMSTLLSQQARLSLLSFAHNAEASEFKLEVAALMSSCVKELSQWRVDSKTRQRRMDERLPSKKQTINMSAFGDKQMVDLTDKSSLSFIRLLRLALPNSAADGADPIELAHRLVENLKSLRHQLELEVSSETEIFSRSRQTAKLLVEKLFGASTTSTTATLTPPAVALGQQKLEAAIQELSSAMETIIREHQLKQHEMASLPKDRLIERQLWVAFFTNPSSLQRLFREMQSK